MANPKSAAFLRPLGSHSMVALIPARAGSKRCEGKNFRPLGGKPLLQWSIEAARACGLFRTIIVSTDDSASADRIPLGFDIHERKPEHATDDAPDILWVEDVLKGRDEEIFAILRPTSPFRTASTIRRAYANLIASEAHSIRAIQKVDLHPGKMWFDDGKLIRPAIDRRHPDGTPWHSSPTQSLPTAYRQNASLEMAWTSVVRQMGTISGYRVAPLLTDAVEGFDINYPGDLERADEIIRSGEWTRYISK